MLSIINRQHPQAKRSHSETAVTSSKGNIVMTSATTFTNTIIRFFGVNVNPQTHVEKAVGKAHTSTAQRYAAHEPALFDKPFLATTGAPIIAAFLDGKQSRHAAAIALSKAWNVDLGPIPARELKRRVADTTMIADTFLTELTMLFDN
jgi:hypothetical protein